MEVDIIKKNTIHLINQEDLFLQPTSELDIMFLIFYNLLKYEGFVAIDYKPNSEVSILDNYSFAGWKTSYNTYTFHFILYNYPDVVCKLHGHAMDKFFIINLFTTPTGILDQGHTHFICNPKDFISEIKIPFLKKYFKNSTQLHSDFKIKMIYPLKRTILEKKANIFFCMRSPIRLEESTWEMIPSNLDVPPYINRDNLFIFLLITLSLECGFCLLDPKSMENWKLTNNSKVEFELNGFHIKLIPHKWNQCMIVNMLSKFNDKIYSSHSYLFNLDDFIDTEYSTFTPKVLKNLKSLSIKFKDNLANRIRCEIFNHFNMINPSLPGIPQTILIDILKLLPKRDLEVFKRNFSELYNR